MAENSYIDVQSTNTFSNYEKVQFFQSDFCSALCNRDWDCFTSSQYQELRQKIAFGLYGPPREISDDGINIVYSKKQEEKVQTIYEAVTKFGSYSRIPGTIYISTIFIFGEKVKKTNDGEIFQTPVFRIKKCHKKIDSFEHFTQFCQLQTYGYSIFQNSSNYCQIFVDDEGRVYSSWENYLKENRLPKCRMYVPKDGIYQAKITNLEKEEYSVDIEICMSPRCSILKELTRTADVVGTVGGIGSMVICGAAAVSAVAVAPAVLAGATIVGMTTGIYAASRSVLGLRDRKVHKQEIGLKDAESRGHWINIAGGVALGSTTGAHQFVGSIAEKTASLGMAGQIAFGGANVLTKGAGVFDSLYLFERRQDMNENNCTLRIFEFIYSLLFFEHATWDIKIVNTFIKDNQMNVLEDYEKHLRINRKRKTFMKALKEIEKTENKENQTTEIIRGLSKVENSTNLCEMLIHTKKLFGDEELTFTVKNEHKPRIRNFLIESSEFSSISITSKRDIINRVTINNLFNKIPEKPKFQLTDNDILCMNVSFEKLISDNEKVYNTIDEMLNIFDLSTRQNLREIIVYFSHKIQDIVDEIERTFANTSPLITILQFVFYYLEKYIIEHQICDSDNIENITFTNVTKPKLINQNMINIFQYVIKCLDQQFIDEIIFSFRVWLEQQINKFWDEYEVMIEQMKKTKENQCNICNGVYYTLI